LLGFYSYTTLLKREGFPVINLPIIVVNTPYLSGDPAKTEADITGKISSSITEIEGVKEIQTTSTSNLSSIFVSLDESITTAEDAKDEIENEISKLNLETEPIIIVPNAALVDGQNDLVFSIYSGDLTIEQLQQKALLIETELEKSDLIKEVNIKNQITTEFDFATQQEVTATRSYARSLVKIDGELEAYDSLDIGVVKKNTDVGTIELSDEVKAIVERSLEKEELDGISALYSADPATYLRAQISSLESNALAAMITIFVILLLFINLRSAILLALFIPLTLASVFFIFSIFGYTLNTISLFALILVLGLFVDDGTIIVEAIDYYKRQGQKGFQAVRSAINDIGIADISGTLTTVLVFLPLVFVTGILGDFIKILPMTVIIALLVSLFIALTILPFLSSFLIKDIDNKKKSKESILSIIVNFVPKLMINFSEKSGRIVKQTLESRYYRLGLFAVSLILIGIGGFYASQLKLAFFAPAKDSDLITISVTNKVPSDIATAKSATTELEKLVVDNFSEEIEEIAYLDANQRGAEIRVSLSPITERDITAGDIVREINELTKDNESLVVSASIVSAGPPVAQFPFAMQLFSENQTVLETKSAEIAEFIKSTELEKDVQVEDVKVDYTKEIRRKDNERFAEIRVKFNDKYDSATLLELQEIIEGEYNGEDNSEFSLGFDFGQESENANSFNSVVFAGLIALIVMYILLVLQFNSFTQPLLILVAIPFSFPILFPGLFYTDNPMSFFVVIGLTGLFGIVVNNTIILTEYANAQRKSGKSIIDSIAESVRLRTRPIFTTSLTTIAGLLPLALTEPFWEPLAFTIIFGLISSVMMIVIAFPVYYFLVESARDLFYKKVKKFKMRGL
jgi:multidrug efflux pump subunit AcrB